MSKRFGFINYLLLLIAGILNLTHHYHYSPVCEDSFIYMAVEEVIDESSIIIFTAGVQTLNSDHSQSPFKTPGEAYIFSEENKENTEKEINDDDPQNKNIHPGISIYFLESLKSLNPPIIQGDIYLFLPQISLILLYHCWKLFTT